MLATLSSHCEGVRLLQSLQQGHDFICKSVSCCCFCLISLLLTLSVIQKQHTRLAERRAPRETEASTNRRLILVSPSRDLSQQHCSAAQEQLLDNPSNIHKMYRCWTDSYPGPNTRIPMLFLRDLAPDTHCIHKAHLHFHRQRRTPENVEECAAIRILILWKLDVPRGTQLWTSRMQVVVVEAPNQMNLE